MGHHCAVELRDFRFQGRGGHLAIDHRVNDDIAESGFDMFNRAEFEPEAALGYPTMHAWVERFDGSGYRTATAFIQWIDAHRDDHQGRRIEDRELDVTNACRQGGLPFFAWGYPAALYDAPAQNMRGAISMRWQATTWFVTIPARWTNHQVQPLLGFQWGYQEDASGVELLPLTDLSLTDWERDNEWLRDQCPQLRFA